MSFLADTFSRNRPVGHVTKQEAVQCKAGRSTEIVIPGAGDLSDAAISQLNDLLAFLCLCFPICKAGLETISRDLAYKKPHNKHFRPCRYQVKTATDDTGMNGGGYVPIKLHFKNRWVTLTYLQDCCEN